MATISNRKVDMNQMSLEKYKNQKSKKNLVQNSGSLVDNLESITEQDIENNEVDNVRISNLHNKDNVYTGEEKLVNENIMPE